MKTSHAKKPFPQGPFWQKQTWGHAILHNARNQGRSADHHISQHDGRLWLVSFGGYGDPVLCKPIPKRLEWFAARALAHYGKTPTH